MHAMPQKCVALSPVYHRCGVTVAMVTLRRDPAADEEVQVSERSDAVTRCFHFFVGGD